MVVTSVIILKDIPNYENKNLIYCTNMEYSSAEDFRYTICTYYLSIDDRSVKYD